MDIVIPLDGMLHKALPVLERLSGAGHQAFYVGGCVRDSLLGRAVADVDVATSATPEQVMALFDRSIPTGLQHGTVTVVFHSDTYEVTTFRTESGYSDFRRPDGVTFIRELEGDLARRDFTINAMALDKDGRLRDPFGGIRDLELRRVRAVGSPGERFQEDALRMLRAIRFAAQLGFELELETWEAVRERSQLLRHVAMERVCAEVDKMLGSAHPDQAVLLVTSSKLQERWKAPLHAIEDKLLSSLSDNDHRFLAFIPDVDARWAAFVTLLGLSSQEMLEWLKYTNLGSSRGATIVNMLRINEEIKSSGISGRRAWSELVLMHSAEAAERWLMAAHSALDAGVPVGECFAAGFNHEQLQQLADWLTDMPVKHMKELRVKGSDLLRLAGKQAGPWVKELLSELLAASASGEVPNEEQALLAYASTRI